MMKGYFYNNLAFARAFIRAYFRFFSNIIPIDREIGLYIAYCICFTVHILVQTPCHTERAVSIIASLWMVKVKYNFSVISNVL